MKVSESAYKDIIGKYFDYSMNWDFLDVVANILERVDFESEDLDESVYNAIDEELIYTEDQWTVMEYYQTPDTANLDDAFWDLNRDILSIAHEIKGE